MKIVVAGASGFIGTALVPALRADGHEVLQLVRREPRAAGEVRWDPARARLDPGALAGTQVAVNLAGAGVGDRRWDDEYKALLRSSRIDTTTTLAMALASLDPVPEVLLNASGISVYGPRGDALLTEASPVGSTFLAGLTEQWEGATEPARDAGIRVVTLRTGLVMAAHGGAFGVLLRFIRLGLGGTVGDGRHWWSPITLADTVDAIRFLMTSDTQGPVNLTLPHPARNRDVTRALAGALNRPAVLRAPRLGLRAWLGEFADEVSASQRVVPRVLLDAGFRFSHPTVEDAARWVAGHPDPVPTAGTGV